MVSKHSFLLMKSARTASRTTKTPTADRKPMASGVTGEKTQRREENVTTITTTQLLLLTTE